MMGSAKMHSKMKLTPEEKRILFALRNPSKKEKLLSVMSRNQSPTHLEQGSTFPFANAVCNVPERMSLERNNATQSLVE